MQVTSAEFQQDVVRYQDAAQREPVAIMRDGRPHAVLVSAREWELLTKGRVAIPVEDLDEETIAAIRRSEVPAEYAHLDALIEDWEP